MDHVSFDTAIMFGGYLEGYPYIIRDLIKENSTDISSKYNGIADTIKEKLQVIYNSYVPRSAG